MSLVRSSRWLGNAALQTIKLRGETHLVRAYPQLLMASQYINISTNPKFISTFYYHSPCQQSVQPSVHPKITEEDVLAPDRVSSQPPKDSSSTLAASADTTTTLHTDRPVDQPQNGSEEAGEEGQNGPLNEYQLRRMGTILAKEVGSILVKRPDYKIYHRDIVLEDNIRGKTFVGGVEYVKQLSYFKIYMYFKYIYNRIDIQSVSIDIDDSTVTLKWTVSGLGMIKVFIFYIPKRLWRSKNMEEFSDHLASGISTYHIGNDSKVIKHVLDVREVDRDRLKAANLNTVEQIKAKVAKLKPNVPAPALFKKVESSSKSDEK